MTTEFTPEGYLQILSEARAQGYRFCPLRGADGAPAGRVMILRHDVDISLDVAIEMARAEREFGVASSYFILPFNDFYNPFSPAGRSQVRALAELGHEIGLHWDSSLYSGSAKAVEAAFRRDLDLLQDVVGQPVVSASQHVPIDTPAVDVERFIANEAYSDRFRDRFAYVSDSCMQWRQHRPGDLVARGIEIQFLAHPIWWFAPGDSMGEKVQAAAARSGRDLENRGADFVDYMERCVAQRGELDARFEAQRAKLRRS